MTERQKFREAFHVALDATPKAIRKLIHWMDHGERSMSPHRLRA